MDIYKFYKKLKHQSILLSFQGELDAEIIQSLFQLLDAKMRKLPAKITLRKRVLYLSNESIQNVYKHTKNNKSVYRKQSVVIIAKQKSYYYIVTSNILSLKKAVFLKKYLRKLSLLDQKGLRKLYIKNLQKENHKKKAGLGLIEIFRKSRGNPEYNFKSYKADHFFFYLYIKIS